MPKGMPVPLLGFNKNPGPSSGWGEGILVDFGAEAVWSKERRGIPRTVALDGTELPPRKHVSRIHSNP